MPRFTLDRSGVRPTHTPILASVALVLLATLLVAACGSASVTVRPTPTHAPQPTATPTVLFQADWSHGLAGWQATSGWSVANGALQNSLGAERSFTIPYQPPVAAFAIEVDLQIVNPTKGGYFIIDVPAGQDGDGFQTGVTGLRAPGGVRPNGDHPTIRTLITPLYDQDTTVNIRSQTDYEPGDQVRAYRINVDAKAIQMYVDGRFYVSGDSTRGPHLASGPLVFRVAGALINVTGLRILAL